MKSLGLTEELHWILVVLSLGEDSGIPSVEVKFVDIGKNTSGASGYLDND